MKILIAGQEPVMDADETALITRYVRIGRRPTTFRLEASTWNLLCKIGRDRNSTVDQLCAEIAEVTAEDLDLAGAIRLYVLGHFCGRVSVECLPAEMRKFLRAARTLQ